MNWKAITRQNTTWPTSRDVRSNKLKCLEIIAQCRCHLVCLKNYHLKVPSPVVYQVVVVTATVSKHRVA